MGQALGDGRQRAEGDPSWRFRRKLRRGGSLDRPGCRAKTPRAIPNLLGTAGGTPPSRHEANRYLSGRWHRGTRLIEGARQGRQVVAVAAHARAEKGLIPPVDADVADAASVRVLQVKLAADRRVSQGYAVLATLLGMDPRGGGPSVEGELVPIAGIQGATATHSAKAVNDRPEVLVLEAERRAMTLRADAFRRSRVPNPTVSVFAQNDGFNERVLGLGLSIPIPLPAPVGRTYAGEIAEADALAQRASIDRTRVERELQLEIADGYATYAAHRAAVEAFTPERTKRAEERLQELQVEIEAGRLGVREALVAQQTLIELLQSNIAERRALCLASVELARALGVPLERGAR